MLLSDRNSVAGDTAEVSPKFYLPLCLVTWVKPASFLFFTVVYLTPPFLVAHSENTNQYLV